MVLSVEEEWERKRLAVAHLFGCLSHFRQKHIDNAERRNGLTSNVEVMGRPGCLGGDGKP